MTDKTPREMVEEFMTTFNTPRDKQFWLKLMDEEANEVIEATENLLKELADFAYVVNGSVICGAGDTDVVTDRVNLAGSILCHLGNGYGLSVPLEAFTRVHASNMSKLDDNGKPIYREDGKVMKGPNYKPPVLTDLVEESF